MAYVGVESETWEDMPAIVVTRVVSLGLFALLGLVVLRVASGGPDWIAAWRITAAFLVFAGALILGQYVTAATTEAATKPFLIDYQLVLLVGLLGITYQSRTPGFGLGVHRPLETVAVFAALVAFCVLAGNPRRYSPVQWLVIGCFATVVGIFFFHSLAVPEASVRSRHPVWAGFLMGTGLVVLPQYLSREQFLWALSRFAAALVVLALPVYVIGEYALYGLRFTFHDSYTIPLIEYEVRAIRSFFVHRNAFATVVLAGLVAALAEFHRQVQGDRFLPSILIAGLLLAINGIGLVLSYGKALWVLTPIVVGIYLAYVLFGRRAIPLAVVGSGVYLASGILAIYTGILDIDPSGRFRLWGASIRAILDQPSVLGEGLIAPSSFIDPYHSSGESPHNSFFSIWIRTGIVGGVAYLLLFAASLLHGLYRYKEVDVAVLALAVGLAGHHMFEAYTMFRWGSGAILVTLVFGFLVFDTDHWRFNNV